MAEARSTLELTARGRVLAGLAAASLLGAWLSEDPNVRIAAALLVAPLLVDFAATPRSLGALRLHVGPRRTVAGAPFQENVHLSYRGRRPLRELLVAEPRTRGRAAFVGRIAPGSRASVVLTCRSTVRSHLLERVFELRTDWPLGMFRACGLCVVATDFVTEPARVQLEASVLQATAEREPAPHTRSQLHGDEFHALREHQPSEEARGVHALRSAALGSLVRTVVRGRMPREVGIVLDLRRPPGRPLLLGARRFEWSLGAGATLLDRLRAMHAIVHVWVLSGTTARTVVQDAMHHREVLTTMAEVGPVAHRALDEATLEAVDAMEHCYWIPAGGFQAEAERGRTRARIHLVGGLRE